MGEPPVIGPVPFDQDESGPTRIGPAFLRHEGAGDAELRAAAAAVLARIRRDAPRVHCLTNTVAEQFTANVLLAVGAIPSMTADPVEAPEFVAGAGALLVNLGTLEPMRREAVLASLAVAERQRIAWVLDPVFVDRAPHRLAFATKLLGLHAPTAIRANPAEIAALFGGGHAGSDSAAPGIDAARAGQVQAAGADVTPTLGSAPAAGRTATSPSESAPAVISTGEIDEVAAGGRTIALGNGHRLMAKVTATGCAVSAMVAACLAVESDAFPAAVAAVGAFGVAAEVAGARAKGPGTFAAHLLDALHALPPEEIADRLNFR